MDENEVLNESLVGELMWVTKDMTDALEDIANNEIAICDIPYEGMFHLIKEWQLRISKAVTAIEQAKLEGKLDQVLFNPSPYAKPKGENN